METPHLFVYLCASHLSFSSPCPLSSPAPTARCHLTSLPLLPPDPGYPRCSPALTRHCSALKEKFSLQCYDELSCQQYNYLHRIFYTSILSLQHEQTISRSALKANELSCQQYNYLYRIFYMSILSLQHETNYMSRSVLKANFFNSQMLSALQLSLQNILQHSDSTTRNKLSISFRVTQPSCNLRSLGSRQLYILHKSS